MMNAPIQHLAPEMGELTTSNHLLGDHAALAQAWERDGYWFFRDVLDKDAIAHIRQTYVDYLVDMGLVAPGDATARYNGAEYAHLPVNSNVTRLNHDKTHRLLHESAPINAFFARLFGCDPFWVPITVHRTNPPITETARSRFDFIHEDGVYNDGLEFLICWVPLDDIDSDVGGIAVVEGAQHGPCLHRRDGTKVLPIELADVPVGKWRRTDYKAGDVLLMGPHTPHSGLSNVSRDRFRLSMDTRVMPVTGKTPLVGVLAEVSESGATVEDGAGTHSVAFGDGSFVRDFSGGRLPLAEVPAHYQPGDEVIVLHRAGTVINMRRPT